MPSQTESKHAGEFLITDSPGTIAHEEVTIVSGQNLKAGDVLGKITASGKYSIYSDADSPAGVGVAVGILYDDVDASGGDKIGAIIVGPCEVDGDLLGWGGQAAGAITNGIADLKTVNIKVR